MKKNYLLVSAQLSGVIHVFAQEGADLNPCLSLDAPGGPEVLCLNRAGDRLYTSTLDGTVMVWAVEAGPRFKLLQKLPVGGVLCWICLSPDEDALLGNEYHQGWAAGWPLNPDGTLVDEPCRRVTAFSAHCVAIPPRGGVCYVPHTETFRVDVFDLAPGGVLCPRKVIPAPMGPRHLRFNANGSHAWSSNELNSTVTHWRVDGDELTAVQTLSSLPEGWQGDNTGAHLLVHPSERFVYASNRGHDSVAVFAVEPGGDLSPVGHIPTDPIPRAFGMDARGEYLYTAGLKAQRLAVHRIGMNGITTPAGFVPVGLETLWILPAAWD